MVAYLLDADSGEAHWVTGATNVAGQRGSLLDVALNYGVELEHACGGNCACTTCHVIVKEGEANLSPMEDDEADRLELAASLTLHSRLACQAVVRGDVVVEIPDWNRNYR